MLDVLEFSFDSGAYYKNQRSQNQINKGRESPKQHHLFQSFKHRAKSLKRAPEE
jgi:hypothetical protein